MHSDVQCKSRLKSRFARRAERRGYRDVCTFVDSSRLQGSEITPVLCDIVKGPQLDPEGRAKDNACTAGIMAVHLGVDRCEVGRLQTTLISTISCGSLTCAGSVAVIASERLADLAVPRV